MTEHRLSRAEIHRITADLTDLDDGHVRRFWAKVEKTDTCWLWTGGLFAVSGYGNFSVHRRPCKAHRIAWALTRGAIPDGTPLDHKCYVRHCVNPDHLQFATTKTNGENRPGPVPGSSSGVRGVTWHKRDRKWQVSAGHNGRNYHGGVYDDLEEAGRAAVALRNRLHTNNLADRKEPA